MKNRLRWKIIQRLHELSWLHVPVPRARFRSRRVAARRRPLTLLGAGLVLDSRTGRILAL